MLSFEFFFRVIVAVFLGGIIGVEREHKRKEAGLRTFALVSLGSCLFTILALASPEIFSGAQVKLDLIRVIQAVAIGIGFLGGGLIVFRQSHIEGLTTAAGLWVCAGVGMAVGMGFYLFSLFVSLIIVAVFHILKFFEIKLDKKFPEDNH